MVGMVLYSWGYIPFSPLKHTVYVCLCVREYMRHVWRLLGLLDLVIDGCEPLDMDDCKPTLGPLATLLSLPSRPPSLSFLA